MSRVWLVGAVGLVGVGCGDDGGSGGGGGADTTSNASSVSSSATTSGATTSSSTAATSGGTTTGGGTTNATSGGGMAQFGEPCMVNADCESMVCHNFPMQGGLLCTLTCDGPEDCPAPSSGCNNMGFCRPN
jgi:hypothetical protein